jgi:hypothetical protein
VADVMTAEPYASAQRVFMGRGQRHCPPRREGRHTRQDLHAVLDRLDHRRRLVPAA